MHDPLDTLCKVFEEELERQENVLRLCALQEQAVLARDTVALNARTEALNLLLRETALAEPARIEAAQAAIDALQLPEDAHTLTGLIAAAPAPVRGRLARLQADLQRVITEASLIVRRNNRVLRRLLSKTNNTIAVLSGVPEAAGGYTTAGRREAASLSHVALINQAG